MAEAFIMPKLGLTMESGKVVSWLVDDGAEVTLGQPVMLIETDKVESEVESTGAGVMHRIAEVGEEYPCGDQIGWLLAPGEEPPAAASVSPAPEVEAAPSNPALAAEAPTAAVAAVAPVGDGGRILASPNAKRVAKARGVVLASVAGTGPGGRITSEDVEAAPVRTAAAPASAVVVPATSGGMVLATAAGRQLAELLGIDLATVPSRSPDPRIGREDVAAHVRELIAAASSPSTAAVAELPALSQPPTKVTALSGMRGTIAERMSASLDQMAQLTLHMDVDMGAVVADRAQRKAAGNAPGFTDYVIAATAAALGDHPYVNSQIGDEGVAELPQINVGMAVALDEGLIVPVVQNTPGLSLDELSAETSRLAVAAREGKLKLTDLEGGTFSVTALGMFEVDGFTPIINAPNTAILGVGRLRDDVAWTDDGQPTKATRLTLSVTWDHRAFDGAPAAEFARTIKRRLEELDL
ncbi:MAG: dihydrolipoamide acetyltransferase family protein [Actinomycetota bacterium]